LVSRFVVFRVLPDAPRISASPQLLQADREDWKSRGDSRHEVTLDRSSSTSRRTIRSKHDTSDTTERRNNHSSTGGRESRSKPGADGDEEDESVVKDTEIVLTPVRKPARIVHRLNPNESDAADESSDDEASPKMRGNHRRASVRIQIRNESGDGVSLKRKITAGESDDSDADTVIVPRVSRKTSENQLHVNPTTTSPNKMYRVKKSN